MLDERATDAPLEGSKRTRTMNDDDAYEAEIGGVSYIILEKLHSKYNKYFEKKKQRSAKVLGEGLKIFIVNQDNVKKKGFESKKKYASNQDYRLVHKSAIADVIAAAKAGSLPRAPKVIKDKDLLFFVDPETRVTYQVEMRGERTQEGTYFKAIDVGIVFEVESFTKIVVDPRKSLEEGRDYVRFHSCSVQLCDLPEQLCE